MHYCMEAMQYHLSPCMCAALYLSQTSTCGEGMNVSAYMVAQIRITDPGRYRQYLAGFMPIFERHGGELLATSAQETVVLEGKWCHPRTVIMRFPSAAHARAWYGDPDYRALAEHRHHSAEANLVMVEGIDG